MRNKVVKVESDRVQEYIDQFNREGWSLISNQTIQEIDHVYDDGDVSTTYFNVLTFVGPDGANDAEITIKEKDAAIRRREYETRVRECNKHRKLKLFIVGMIVFLVILSFALIVIGNVINQIVLIYVGAGILGLIGLILGIIFAVIFYMFLFG